MMDGARVRVTLVQEDLQHEPPRIEFDDDVRELLWPGFFAIQKYSDRNPVQLVLPNNTTTPIPLDFLGSSDNEGHWGTTGSPEFWGWQKSINANAGDDLIFESLDGEQRRYRVGHDPKSKRGL